ncbi:type II-A CRISPR-associated protein Csn2 [Galactobacillus timonensis]|uniref:type II-A CRISPR-associated protein Csn2 n=1 Tax=Galactobacillus timonensis TaxID=2041840 RepID=UPI000C84D91E|nr:type II-A CRISPR-associated protein Csn2 [Galactobacillus timonensis]
MILVNPNYFDPISITEEYPETLVVEDNFYYRSILTDMIEQLKTGKGDFVLSENEEIISCQNIQIVTDLLQMDFSDRTAKTRLQQTIAFDFRDDPAVESIREDLYHFCFKICTDYPLPVSFKMDLTAIDLVKMMDFFLDLSFSSWVEKIILLLEAERSLLKKNLFIFSGLKDLMNKEEYAALEKELKYRKFSVLMIEHREHQDLDDKDHLRIIDKDLCLIE